MYIWYRRRACANTWTARHTHTHATLNGTSTKKSEWSEWLTCVLRTTDQQPLGALFMRPLFLVALSFLSTMHCRFVCTFSTIFFLLLLFIVLCARSRLLLTVVIVVTAIAADSREPHSSGAFACALFEQEKYFNYFRYSSRVVLRTETLESRKCRAASNKKRKTLAMAITLPEDVHTNYKPHFALLPDHFSSAE